MQGNRTEAGPYLYRAFGLEIRSEIHCPELTVGGAGEQVCIMRGSVASVGTDSGGEEVRIEAEAKRFLLTVDGVARFLVDDAERIVVDAEPGVDERRIRLYLLGSVLAALLHQRGLLTLHASVVRIGDRCAAFMGPSGIGKSTLAATFRKQGYPVVADDVCCVLINESEGPTVFPGFPQIKLWEDSARYVGERPEDLFRVHPDAEKHGLILEEGIASEPLPLGRFYLLGESEDGEFELSRMQGFEKMEALASQTYRWYILDALGLKVDHFKQCTLLARRLDGVAVRRPAEGMRVKELVELIVKDFEK